jgi:alkylated DNA nucleotide flippase Atl1
MAGWPRTVGEVLGHSSEGQDLTMREWRVRMARGSGHSAQRLVEIGR